MKKYVILVVVLISVIMLSGCSLTKTSTTAETPAPTKGSLMKSINSGENWSVMWDKKINILNVDVLSMAINPFDDRNVLVGLKSKGILQTIDGGESWSMMKFSAEKVYGLTFDPIDSRIIYASGVVDGRGKIFKSIDSGETWTEVYISPADGPLLISLVLDNKNTRFLYVSTSDNRVIKSSDAGKSWKYIYQSTKPILKIALDERTGNIFMLQSGGKVFRSKDKGKSFEDITKKIGNSLWGGPDSYVLEKDPSHAGWLYIAGKGGVFRSRDSGEKWDALLTLNDPKSYPVRSLAINPRNSNEIIYGAAQAVYRSVDGGINWSTWQTEEPKVVDVIKYSQQDPMVVYLGMSAIKK